MVAVFYRLPLEGRYNASSGAALVLLLAGFVVLGTLQVRSVLHAPYPVIRATEVLALLIPLFVLTFAGYYYVVDQQAPSSFNASLTRTDALYFTVTVLATVGFGDIVPVSEAARVAVTVQMVADLVVLGVLIRTVSRAVSGGWNATAAASPAAGDAPAPVPAEDR